MTIAGRLDIDLTCRSGPSASARIASRRPQGVTRMFRGRRPAEVASLVPLVFSVCGMAQGAAAATACERALGIATSSETRRIRDISDAGGNRPRTSVAGGDGLATLYGDGAPIRKRCAG